MKIILDTDQQQLCIRRGKRCVRMPLFGRRAFETLSRWWVKVGWNEKYTYTFTWLGRPIIQLPEDMFRLQELIWRVQPDVIVETGVAHGGSLVFYASLCHAMGRGRVIGVDVEIRPHNRKAITDHILSRYITLIEGDSVSADTVRSVASLVKPRERVLLILDSCHTKKHVLAELEAYGRMVTPGSFAVVADGIMRDLSDVPRGKPEWKRDNPMAAAAEFLKKHPEFELIEPEWAFNESGLRSRVTHWPNAYLRRKLVTEDAR